MNKKTIFIFLLLLILSIAIMLAPLPGMFVTITEKNGRAIVAQPVEPGDIVSLTFVHSVEKVRITDTFIVTPEGTLSLQNTTFGSTGYGLPTDASYNITVNEDGDFLIENINKTYEMIVLSTGSIPRHNVTIAGRTYPLYSMTGEGTQLIIGIELNRPIYKAIFNV